MFAMELLCHECVSAVPDTIDAPALVSQDLFNPQ